MSPDQVLVLVNGKRLHTSSLLHINGTIGRGSSHVDLDTIAVKSIERVEVLRDGAAAQYGSDAISGVINIILKGVGHEDSISVSGGQRANGDGQQLYTDAFLSLPTKYDGFVNVTFVAKGQEKTNNAGIDARTGVTPPRVTTSLGIPESQNYLVALNMELPQENDVILYSNALLNDRSSTANAFYRAPSASSLALYPNGFLPMVNAKVLDLSVVAGARGEVKDLFKWDISNTYGYNKIGFYVNDTMNYALGASSPTSFDNGGFNFTQNTTNLDIEKKIERLTLAGGAEYRYEKYQITAGEGASYLGSGTQGLGAYRPESTTDTSRNSYALYLDAKYALTDNFSMDGATRYEHFTDFGSTNNVKLALGYKLTPEILLRSSASTGFRAPSLTQSNYSYMSTYVDSGTSKLNGIFKPSAEVSKAFGAENLKPETSKHLSLGTVYKPTDTTSFMIDYFYVTVNDKIMLSNPFGANATPAQQAVLNAEGVYRASFFTNAVNTKTQGVDIKLNHTFMFDNSSQLDSGMWYNYSQNRVVGFNSADITRENSLREIDRLENGQPKSSLKILNKYSYSQYEVALNVTRFDAYQETRSNIAYTFDPAWTTDLDFAYKISKNATVAIGGTNIFNVMPSKWDGLSGSGSYFGYDGIIPYSLYSPFGLSGAYYYARATIKF
jgi:iron complex outermembrane receptor protein